MTVSKYFNMNIVRVNDKAIASRETNWGALYELYKESGFGNRYFMDYDDCSKEVREIKAKSDDEAIQKFNDCMDDLEKEVTSWEEK